MSTTAAALFRDAFSRDCSRDSQDGLADGTESTDAHTHADSNDGPVDAPVDAGPISPIFNGTFTIENTRTREHRTFSIRTQAKDAKFAPGKRILALLSGPDNEGDYVGFAFVDDNGIYVWKRKRGAPDTPSLYEKYAKLLWRLVTNVGGWGDYYRGRGYMLLHEGRCIVCNRKLTTPESIRRGIGPVCEGRA